MNNLVAGDGAEESTCYPNLLTTAALSCGFFAITSAINGRYENAAIAIIVALILDGLDGRVARLTNTQSDLWRTIR